MKPSRRGPKLPIARLERAVELKLLGFKWGEIAKKTKTPYGTLVRWYATPEWKELEAEWLAQDPLVRRARAVIARGLAFDLIKKGRPDTSLAERILTPATRNGDGDYPPPASATAQTAVFMVPMPDRGLESKPVHEVLARPPGPPAAPSSKSAGTPTKASKRRRIVSEEEAE